jgi:hypothetical protein
LCGFFSNFKNSCVKKWQAVAKKWQAVAIFLPFEKLDCGLKYFIMTTNHEISLQTAVDMTNRYRANKPANFPICETFGADAIRRLLATPGCVSLRIYYGMKAGNEVDAILVAANEAGEDILPNLSSPENLSSLETDEPVILEDSLRCPDHCPPPSSLNTD